YTPIFILIPGRSYCLWEGSLPKRVSGQKIAHFTGICYSTIGMRVCKDWFGISMGYTEVSRPCMRWTAGMKALSGWPWDMCGLPFLLFCVKLNSLQITCWLLLIFRISRYMIIISNPLTGYSTRSSLTVIQPIMGEGTLEATGAKRKASALPSLLFLQC